mmetsp:Transcript_48617/g.141668  ORF Transcript_48617/g.141668 Transcript_48617/m.141668 type:complete len:216 (+) Transcript_48617:194-841(+)
MCPWRPSRSTTTESGTARARSPRTMAPSGSPGNTFGRRSWPGATVGRGRRRRKSRRPRARRIGTLACLPPRCPRSSARWPARAMHGRRAAGRRCACRLRGGPGRRFAIGRPSRAAWWSRPLLRKLPRRCRLGRAPRPAGRRPSPCKEALKTAELRRLRRGRLPQKHGLGAGRLPAAATTRSSSTRASPGSPCACCRRSCWRRGQGSRTGSSLSAG